MANRTGKLAIGGNLDNPAPRHKNASGIEKKYQSVRNNGLHDHGRKWKICLFSIVHANIVNKYAHLEIAVRQIVLVRSEAVVGRRQRKLIERNIIPWLGRFACVRSVFCRKNNECWNELLVVEIQGRAGETTT